MASIIDILTDIKNTIKSRLIVILIISLLAAGIQGFITRSYKGVYGTYSKIFPLSINKSGGSSPIDAIRAQFGISDKTDYEKIYNVKELVTSKTISTNIAKSKPIRSKFKSMSAWLIADYNKDLPFWEHKMTFNPKDPNDIHYRGVGLLMAGTSIVNDPKTNFTKISTESSDTALTQEMNDKILEELSNYYIKLVTEKPRTDLMKIQIMRDSLKNELNATERAMAGFADSNQLSVMSSTQLPRFKLERARKEIEALYTTTATSYQNAKFKLLSESPIFQVLDQAGPPYTFEKPSWKKSAAIVFVISCFILGIFFCRKVFWKLIVDELSKS